MHVQRALVNIVALLSVHVNRVASAARLFSNTAERAREVFASHARSAIVIASHTLVYVFSNECFIKILLVKF